MAQELSSQKCSGGCASCPFQQDVCTRAVRTELTVGVFDAAGMPALPSKIIIRDVRLIFSSLNNISDILDLRPDVVLYRADATRLEDTLYPVTKIIDLPLKTLINLENYPALLRTQHSVDLDTLSSLLGIPVIAEDSTQDDALARILASILDLAIQSDFHHARIDFGRDIERLLPEVFPDRYIALRLMEKEDYILPYIKNDPEQVMARSLHAITALERNYHRPSQELIREARRAFIKGALQETFIHSRDNSDHTAAQKIDSLLTNRLTGLPILILVLLGIFEATFALGAYPQEWLEKGIDALTTWLSALLPEGWLSSMLTDGVIQGVGAVLAFLPNIIILFFFLSLLEDSGYMARAAFLLDKLMHKIGLHGKSFIPMLIGFGCNVPAIMAARDIEDRRDRTLTMLMIPFMSCSARLPVYMLLVSAFFARYKALVMIGIYLTGILLSVVFALLMKRTKYFRKPAEDYVTELPAFSFPPLRSIWGHIWERTSDYLQKISTVILAASVIIWALEYFPRERPDNQPYAENSALAIIGKTVQPVVEPLGFDWKMSVCLLTGLPAKEAIVSTMGILYAPEDEDGLVDSMRAEVYEDGPRRGQPVFTPAVALSFMVFVLLYFPCVATIGTLKRETNGKWAAFTVVHSLVLAWVAAFLVFRIVSLF